MAQINILTAPMQGYTATERAIAISRELWAIEWPPVVRQGNEISTQVFDVLTHPTTGEAVIKADTAHVIRVHPDNKLTKLIALMPALPQQVKNGLVALIENSQTITFSQLLTGTETILTDEQMATDGWFETPKEA